MEIANIIKVEQEIKRFTKTLALAKQRLQVDSFSRFQGCKETGALKRAQLDLKRCLTDNLS